MNKIHPPAVPGECPPFQKFDPLTFQKLCRDIAAYEDHIKNANIFGVSGQAQYGIDVIAKKSNGTVIVYQCKRFESITPKVIKNASDEFLKHYDTQWKEKKITHFILFIACELEDTKLHKQKEEEKEKFAEKSIEYEIWPSNTICLKLSSHPNIVARFFQDSLGWIEKICGIPFNDSLNSDCIRIRSIAKQVLSGIHSQIGSIELPRDELRENLKKNIKDNRSVIVCGEAGHGKSAIVKNLFKELTDTQYEVLALKADNFGFDYIHKVEKQLSLTNPFEKILEILTSGQEIIVLIDGLEKLLDVKDRQAILYFFELIKDNLNIRIVLTCRTFALNSLFIDFGHNLKGLQIVTIPPLNDYERDIICQKYIQEIDSIPKRFKPMILSNPFYSNRFITNTSITGKISAKEVSFYSFFWNEIIVKDNQLRGQYLKEIAYNRAVSMNNFISLNDYTHCNVISELTNEGIITKSSDNQFSPGHDIFEDFGLITYIREQYQKNVSDHYALITVLDGNSPIVRRGYRLWMNVALEDIDYDLSSFIHNVIEDTSIDLFWRDETITALLNSAHLNSYLEENRDTIIQNKGSLFARLLKILVIACQQPDNSFSRFMQKELGKSYYSDYFDVRPSGTGWGTLIQFFHNNRSEFSTHLFSVVEMISTYWTKLITINVLPPYAKEAGEILLQFVKKYRDVQIEYHVNNDWRKRFDKFRENPYTGKRVDTLFQGALITLFKLSELFKQEITELVKEALERKERIRTYDEEFFKVITSYGYSAFLCKHLPELVTAAAFRWWTREKRKKKVHSLGFVRDDRMELEELFGLKGRRYTNAKNAAPTQTFFPHLLKFNFWRGFDFLIQFINRSTEKYVQDYDKFYKKNYSPSGNRALDMLFREDSAETIQKIFLKADDGNECYIWGNQTLWGLFRQPRRSVPDLLQSLLVAFENYLLQVMETKEEMCSLFFEKVAQRVIEDSRSVSLFAVLVSVGIAYPEKIGKTFLNFFKIKEFYLWDLERKVMEQTPRIAIGISDLERNVLHRIDSMPHRSRDLSELVIKLQLSTAYRDYIWEIFDSFKDNFDSFPADIKTLLTRIDRRNWEPGEIVKTDDGRMGIQVHSKLDEKTKKEMKKSRKESEEIFGLLEIESLGRRILKGKSEESNIKEWRKNYKILQSKNVEEAVSFDAPAYLSVIGLKYHFEELKEKEWEWCFEQYMYFIRGLIRFPWDQHIPQASGAASYAISLIPELFPKLSDRSHEQFMLQVFLFFLMESVEIDGFNHEITVAETIKQMEKHIPDFIEKIIHGLIRFANRLGEIYYPENVNREERPEHQRKLIDTMLKKTFADIDTPKTITKPLDRDTIFPYRRILILLPYWDKSERVQEYFTQILRFILINENQEIFDYELKTQWADSYAGFLFKLSVNESSDFFKQSLILFTDVESDWKYLNKSTDVYKELLNSLFNLLERNPSDDNYTIFWKLWDDLSQFITECNDSSLKKVLTPKLFLPMFSLHSLDEKIISRLLKNKRVFYRNASEKWGKEYFSELLHLLAGIGFVDLMPDGISWVYKLLKEHPDLIEETRKENLRQTFEKCIQRLYHLKNNDIRKSRRLKEELVYILNELIEMDSPTAYIFRDRILSLRQIDVGTIL